MSFILGKHQDENEILIIVTQTLYSRCRGRERRLDERARQETEEGTT